MGMCRIPCLLMTIFLLLYPKLVILDSAVNSTTVSQGDKCSDCYSSTCPEGKSCLQECTQGCPGGYYQIIPAETFVCEPRTTTTVTTRSATTEAVTTTTAPTTTTTNQTTNVTTNIHVEAANSNTSMEHRRRREAGENSTTENTSTVITTTPTIVTSTVTVTTTAVTTPTPKLVCKLCSIKFCSFCKDDTRNKTVCGQCLGGYQLGSDKSSCITDEDDQLPAGAIVGIIIGSLGFVAMIVVVVVFGVRYCRSHNISGDQEPAVPSRELSISAPRPKINTEDMQRQHDRITRYTKDPTIKKTLNVTKTDVESTPEENYEIAKLGPAPTLPKQFNSKSYDTLQTTHHDEAQSYTALEGPDDELYVNNAKAMNDLKRNKSANTQAASSSGTAYSNVANGSKKITEKTVSAESAETYEAIDSRQDQEEPQELYINSEFIKAVQSSSRDDNEESEELYVNDKENNEEEVYEIV